MGIGVPADTYLENEDLEEEQRQLSGEATPEPEPHAYAHTERAQALDNLGFSEGPEDDDEERGDQPQRVFSIGGSEERTTWTEVNARKRMGFKDDEGPS
jgi:hypothetical protein